MLYGNFHATDIFILQLLDSLVILINIQFHNECIFLWPAAFTVHQPDRNMYEEIASDISNSGVDVINNTDFKGRFIFSFNLGNK